jgi:hypothetical protein
MTVAKVLTIGVALGMNGRSVAVGRNGAEATWQNVRVASGGGDDLPAPAAGP